MSELMQGLSFALPIVAAAFMLLLVVLNMWQRIRKKVPKSVNCWFCNGWTKVLYDERNNWFCPTCDQYNGFTEDGDYNVPIPAQHDEMLNMPLRSSPKPIFTSNGLCNICNNNQQLKVHQLAMFTPLDEARYDEEVEVFKRQLERAYRLCPRCEFVLRGTLQKQKAWLIHRGLASLRSHGMSLLNGGFSAPIKSLKILTFANFLRFVLVMLAWLVVSLNFDLDSIILFKIPIYNYWNTVNIDIINKGAAIWMNVEFERFYQFMKMNYDKCVPVLNDFIYFELHDLEKVVLLAGLVCQFLLFAYKGISRKTDLLCSVVWGALYFYEDIKAYPDVKIIAVLLVALLNRRQSRSSLKVKRSDSKAMKEICSIEKILDQQMSDLDVSLKSDATSLNSSVSSITSPSVFSGFSTMNASKSSFGRNPTFDNPFAAQSIRSGQSASSWKSANSTLQSGASFCLNSTLKTANSSPKGSEPPASLGSESCIFQARSPTGNPFGSELHSSLVNLKLGSPLKKKHPVISPPKLRNVSQSSWVAGGFWTSPQPEYPTAVPVTLSRSSSQSSGFESQASSVCNNISTSNNIGNVLKKNGAFNSLPSSRCNSISDEADRLSVFSEPAYRQTVYHNPSQSALLARTADSTTASGFCGPDFLNRTKNLKLS